ncbi:MAG: hypothetical protein LBQ43_01075 [Holosporales bacterium]|jgi:hypothetical protein|nr:hypothetical protein [Holosporales bacterium]
MYSLKKHIAVISLAICNIYADGSATSTPQQSQKQFVSIDAENFVKDKNRTGEEVYFVLGDQGSWRFCEDNWFFLDGHCIPSGRGICAYATDLDAWKELPSKLPGMFSIIFDDYEILRRSIEPILTINACINLLKSGGAIIGKRLFSLLEGLSSKDIDDLFNKCEIYMINDSNNFVERVPWGIGGMSGRIFSSEGIEYIALLIKEEMARKKKIKAPQIESQSADKQTSKCKSVGERICEDLSPEEQDIILKASYLLENYNRGRCEPISDYSKDEIAVLKELANKSNNHESSLQEKATDVVINAVKKAVPCLKKYWRKEKITQGLKPCSPDEVKGLMKLYYDFLVAACECDGEEPPEEPTQNKGWYVFIKK